jgi:putative ABC transport system permease protein
MSTGGSKLMTIVGIVSGIKHSSLESDPKPAMYRPLMQSSWEELTLTVQSKLPPEKLTAAIREQVATVDKDQPVANVQTMESLFAKAVAPQRFQMILVALFASLALVLAMVGIYGVMAYSVTQRTHEIGIRMALGARRLDVLKLVMAQGLVEGLVGIAIGLAGAFALTRLLSSLLYGVSATDPLIFTGISLLLGLVALLACYLPARRATAVDPMTALRYE